MGPGHCLVLGGLGCKLCSLSVFQSDTGKLHSQAKQEGKGESSHGGGGGGGSIEESEEWGEGMVAGEGGEGEFWFYRE